MSKIRDMCEIVDSEKKAVVYGSRKTTEAIPGHVVKGFILLTRAFLFLVIMMCHRYIWIL